MKRVRFAPSPTGSLHVGNALSAVANRDLGDWMLLRIDDTDAARNVPGGEGEILSDLEWLGVAWDEGPMRQSERQDRYREAAEPLGGRFDGITLLRQTAGRRTTSRASSTTSTTGSPTSSVATTIARTRHSTVGCSRRWGRPAGVRPPRADPRRGRQEAGQARARRDGRVAARGGIPSEAVRSYLQELGVPRHDVRYDLPRIRRLAVEAIGTMRDEELARRVGAPVEVVPALRGARDLNEAREYARAILTPPAPAPSAAGETLARFRELLGRTNGEVDARALVRELKAVGGDLKAVRLALTGAERGPELWAVIAALPKDEALRRIDAAL